MENTDFGWLLQKYRRRARDPLRSGKLTQERLAELFAEEVGINYSRGAISDWERGKSQINKDDRTVLVGLVTVLYRCRGITRLDQANDWLATGNYRPLDKAEREGVAAEWAIEGDREQKDQLFEGSKSDPVMVTARITGPGQTTTTRTFDPLPHRMPVPATPFVGRQDELVAMDILLADPAVRLVTIVGAGGMGKTRLAMEVAERQVAGSAGNGRRFSNGIYFVPLAPVDHDDGVVPTVAEALNFPIQTEATEMREPGQQLCDYLRHKNILFVMDNVEHLPAAGELVAHILRCAPRVQILATSREPLYLTDEQIYPIRGLTFSSGEISTTEADVDLPAIALFLQSAHRVRPDFSPSGEGMVTLAHICHLLDGMPLGIELAASWVGVLSLDDVAAEIEGSLDFLVTRLRDIPDRHRSLRAVIDSSWDRLSKKEKAVFSQASVFRGGFTRRAASQITDAALPLLASLADKSMLYFIRDRQRYEVHETLRQFGAGKLAEDKDLEKATRDNHSAYYLETLQSRLLDLKGERQRETLEDIESDIENARNAWNWAVAQEHTEQVDRAIDSLNLFYERRGRYREGESACRMAVEQFSKEPKTGENNPERERVLVKVLAWQIRFSYLLGWGEQVDRLLPEVEKILESENLAPADTRSERAFILQLRGQRAGDADLNEAQKLHREALGLYQELGDQWGQANNLFSLGRCAWQVGEYDQAQRLLAEGLDLRRALGDQAGLAAALAGLGKVEFLQGSLENSRHLTEESLVICGDLNDRTGVAHGLARLSETHMMRGDFAQAHSLIEEAVAIGEDLGDQRKVAHWTTWIGALINLHLGNYGSVRNQMHINLAYFRQVNDQVSIAMALRMLGSAALAEGNYKEALRLHEESAEIHRVIGQYEEMTRALGLASYAARELGLLELAQERFYDVLQMAVKSRSYNPLVISMPGVVLLLADAGRTEWAVELWAMVNKLRVVSNSNWFQDVAGDEMAAIEATLPERTFKRVEMRGRNKDIWETAGELVNDLRRLGWAPEK